MILVLAEHENGELKESTLNVVEAARKLGKKIDVLVIGSKLDKVIDEAKKISDVTIIKCEDNNFSNLLAEQAANQILDIADNYKYILAPSNTFGKNILPRVAAKKDVAQITDVIEIVKSDTFKRPIYAGNAIATVKSKDDLKIMTIRLTAFEKASLDGNSEVKDLKANTAEVKSNFISVEKSESERPDLTEARVVISGGRGLGSAENFKILEELADKIPGSAIGASRAAVDSGYVPNDYQIGQTGKIVAPELYMAFGISGAIQHLAGMMDSKVIIAVNKDENAPIFDVADYGLVADLFDVVEEIKNIL